MGAVIFDIGKVLLDFDYAPVAEALSLRCLAKMPSFECQELQDIFDDYHRGAFSCTHFWQFFRSAYSYTGSYQEFENDICCSYQVIPRGLDVFNEMLSTPQIKVGILSDNNHICTRWIARELPEVFSADVLVLSQEVGMLKPEPQIYELTVARLQMEPERCLFIDDRYNNIQGAEAVGLQGLLHRDWEESYPKLKAFVEQVSIGQVI